MDQPVFNGHFPTGCELSGGIEEGEGPAGSSCMDGERICGDDVGRGSCGCLQGIADVAEEKMTIQ
jgi:hypothetical protein